MNPNRTGLCAIAALVSLATAVAPSLASAEPQPKLWGWADLHAHPSAHLAFGASEDGTGGILWGSPGLALSTSSPQTDMPACSPDKHGGFDMDWVRHVTHTMIIGSIDNKTGFAHGANGASTFESWPNALSLTHQQMHVTMLKRAYDGGQRVLIASVTDNELLAALWTKIGYNADGNPVPLPDSMHDFNSAVRQINFLKQFAAANPSWMEIAYSSADARRIVASNRLAIILSLEMDSLTPAQTLQLVQDHGVRHVIPIHLVNNAVGGTAVYDDVFNTANAFLHASRQTNNWNRLNNDGFLDPDFDTLLRNRLGRPQTLVPDVGNLATGGAIWPVEVDDITYAWLGYDGSASLGGHKNSKGLEAAGLELLAQLAARGVLIDVAHMSEYSTAATIAFAKPLGYPLMDSHTGLRSADETADNERSLRRSHAREIANLGGLIGLGTEGSNGLKVMVSQPTIPHPGMYLIRFSSGLPSATWPVMGIAGNPVLSALTVTIATGGDDLRGGNNRVWARVNINGTVYEWDLSGGAAWANGTTHTVSFSLPTGTRADSIRSFGLRTVPDAKNNFFDTADNWVVDQLMVKATLQDSDAVGTWLSDYQDVLNVMQGRGVAIGTDINGFAQQMSFSSQAVNYPLTATRRFGRMGSPALSRATIGSRTVDFQSNGIAHYGMLADLVQAVSQKDGSGPAVGALFQSANDLVEMWERCESTRGFSGDYNGDGRADIAVWNKQTNLWTMKLSTGSGFNTQSWNGAWGSDGPIYSGDFNGDGKTDLIMWRPSNLDWRVNLSTGTGFNVQTWNGAWGSDGPVFLGDFNGDGKTDVMMWRRANNDWTVNLSTGSSFQAYQVWHGHLGSDGPIIVGDFNGDHKTDVMMSRQANNDWTVNLSTGAGFNTQVWSGAFGNDGPIQVGDFNGDGKTDVMMWRQAVNDWTVNLSTGAGFTFQVWSGAYGSDGPIQVGDFNGDGKSDVMMWRQSNYDWTVNLSTGTGFRPWQAWGGGAWGSDGPVHLGDFNGDGKTDVVMYRQAVGDWTTNLSTGSGFSFRVW